MALAAPAAAAKASLQPKFQKASHRATCFCSCFFLDFGHAFLPLSDDPALFWPELELVQPGGRADRCAKPTFLGRGEEPGAP